MGIINNNDQIAAVTAENKIAYGGEYPRSVINGCADIVLDIVSILKPALTPACNAEGAYELLCAKFDAVIKSCRASRLPDDASHELLYPLAALADEVNMNIPQHRAYWSERPLQLRYFGEVTAGAAFFTKLEALIGSREKKTYALELYFICLALGFKGIYGSGNAQRLRNIFENLGIILMDARLKGREALKLADSSLLIDKRESIKAGVKIPAYVIYLGIASLLSIITAAVAYLAALVKFTEFLGHF